MRVLFVGQPIAARDDDTSTEQTTRKMVQYCVSDVGVLSAEVELLRPTHLVCYRAGLHPEVLRSVNIDGGAHW